MQYTSYQFQHQHKFVYLSWPCALCRLERRSIIKKLEKTKNQESLYNSVLFLFN